MTWVARWIYGLGVRFVRAWDRDRWQLIALAIPFTRAALYVAHLAPAQLDDETVPNPWQAIVLGVLGVSALIAMIGTLCVRPVLERTGLQLLGPLSVIYGLASVVSEPDKGVVTLVVYCMIAACCIARGREITRAVRIVNRALDSQEGAP